MIADRGTTGRRRGYLAIEAYRGIAALAVAIGHAIAFFGDHAPAHSYLAVDFFFMLSGIVMAHSYDARFEANSLSQVGFLKLRVIRLYPVIVAATIFAAAVHAVILAGRSSATPFVHFGQIGEAAVLTALLIPQPWFSENYYPLNGPFWSLLFELLVNIVFALAWRWIRGAGLYFVIIGSAALIIFLPTEDGGFDQGFHSRYALLAVARTSFGFFIGVAISRLRGKLTMVSNLAIAGGALVLFAVFWQRLDAAHPLDRMVVLLILPPIAWFATRFEPSGVLEKISRFLGKISYPLYAFNLPAVLAAAAVFKMSGLKLVFPGWVLGLIFIALSLAAAWIVDSYFDGPVRRLLTKVWIRDKKPVPSGGDTSAEIG